LVALGVTTAADGLILGRSTRGRSILHRPSGERPAQWPSGAVRGDLGGALWSCYADTAADSRDLASRLRKPRPVGQPERRAQQPLDRRRRALVAQLAQTARRDHNDLSGRPSGRPNRKLSLRAAERLRLAATRSSGKGLVRVTGKRVTYLPGPFVRRGGGPFTMPTWPSGTSLRSPVYLDLSAS
jgi:hypothetical protein